MMEEQLSNKNELWKLSLRDIFYKYIRFLPLFVLAVAFCLLLAYLYLRYTIPIYSVSGSMLIRSEQPQQRTTGLEGLISSGNTSNIQNEIEVLKSRPLMERVVDSLGLQLTYRAKGKIKTVNIYKQEPFEMDILDLKDSTAAFTFKVKFLNENDFRIGKDPTIISFNKPFRNEYGVFRFLRKHNMPLTKEYSVSWTPTSSAASGYAGAVQVNMKMVGTGILVISMRNQNADLAADVINKLMEEYGRYSVEQKDKASVQKLKFIDDRVADYRKKIDSVQQLLNDFEKRNNLIDVKTQSAIQWENISTGDKFLNEQTSRLNTAGILSEYIGDRRNQYEKVPTTFDLNDVTLTQLVGEYNKMQIARQMLLDANIPIANPSVQEKTAELDKLRNAIQENLKNIRSSISTSIGTVRGKTAQNQQQLNALPEKVKEQIQIQNLVMGYEGFHKFLQEEKEKEAIIKSANVSNSEVINMAYASRVPVKPNKKLIQLLAILIGISLPAIFIFLSELMNDKVTTRFDIEKITAAPILGEIGHSYSDTVLVVNKTTRSMVAEQFRIIRSNLQYVLNQKEKSTILFTSSFSGEGKSYVTTNMGAVLALAGKKTVILEFDIRKPKILSGLNIPKGPGITNFLIGKGDLKDLVKPVEGTENLYVLGCGPIPPNPSELLLDKRMDELFAWLKENFDIVLVDTAPVGMVSDAMTLSKFADSTLYLVRQGHTFKKQIGLIDEFYKEEKLPKVSIIINDVKMKLGYGYYGYGRYGYGYGYGYGSYYEEEVAPLNFFERIIAWLDITRFFKKPKKKRAK